MPRCERCLQAEAVIAVGPPERSGPFENLCLACAESRLREAWGWPGDFSPVRLAMGVRQAWSGREPQGRWDEAFCPRCGLPLAEFEETGMLGCPDCYEAFSSRLEEVFLNLHGSIYHRGSSVASG